MILLTEEQVIQHMSAIKLKHGYIVERNSTDYWKDPLGSGSTPHITEAIRGTIQELYRAVINWGGHPRYELVDQELAEKLIKYKCNAHQVLGASLLKMLESAPLNPSIRAQVMAIVGQMPPPELDTYDKIREWVETTHDPAIKAEGSIHEVGPNVHFGIRTRISQAFSGTCRFSGTETAYESPNLQPRIDEYIRGSNQPLSLRTMSEIMRAESIRRVRNMPVEDNDEDYTYEDHVTTSEGEIQTDIVSSIDTTINDLKNHIETYYPREVQRRFGL